MKSSPHTALPMAQNARAIGVYRRLGFTDRTQLPLWLLQKASRN